jgi:hypothetical protein
LFGGAGSSSGDAGRRTRGVFERIRIMWGVAGRAAAALTAVLWLSSCGGITDPSNNKVDPFPSTLIVGGSNVHPFSASKNGEFSMKLTAIAPTPDVFVGTIFGQVANGQCQPYPGYVNQFSQLNRSSLQGPIQKGSWCAIVYDSGGLTEDITYTLEVSHP